MPLIKVKDYRVAIKEFNKYKDKTNGSIIGLCSEAGEVAGVYDKYSRGKTGYWEFYTDMKEEIGDVFFHLFSLMNENGLCFEEVLQDNYDKLTHREAMGENGS